MKMHVIGLMGLVAVLGASFPGRVLAGTELKAVAGGVSVATPMGDNYEIYSQPIGFRAEAWADNEAVLGSAFQLHLSGGYLPFKIINLPNYVLQQWAFFAGLETNRNASANWIKPFAGLDFGAAYTRLGTPAGYTNVVTNSSLKFALQGRTGFEIPVWGSLSAQVAAPLTVIFGTSKFVSFSGDFSLKWAL